ncbi:rhodanese-like domain-containing protein [Kitasatospora gansuensis]
MRDSREKGTAQDFTVIDVRAEGAHRKTHLPGAISLPLAEITAERVAELPAGLLVVYCWGPACNGSTKGAMKLAALGREVKEMIGGLEYWIREGWPTEGRRPVDPKTATPADLGLVC